MSTLALEFGFTAQHAQALTLRAFDLVEAGEFEGAVDIFRGLLAINPLDGGLQAALGAALQEQGKIAEAQAAYAQSIELDPDAPLARVNRGELRCKRGDFGGLDDLRRACMASNPLQVRAQGLLRRYSQ